MGLAGHPLLPQRGRTVKADREEMKDSFIRSFIHLFIHSQNTPKSAEYIQFIRKCKSLVSVENTISLVGGEFGLEWGNKKRRK